MNTNELLENWRNVFWANKPTVGDNYGLLAVLANHQLNKSKEKDYYTRIVTTVKYEENLETLKDCVRKCIKDLENKGAEINGWILYRPDENGKPTIEVYKEITGE